MREIKFRAWNKAKEVMELWPFEDFQSEEDGTFSVNGYEVSDDEDTVALMQYTGLKDKNGKEIYEGDILNIYKINIGAVKWNNAGFLWNNNHLGIYAKEDIFIIGNVWENPELLKD